MRGQYTCQVRGVPLLPCTIMDTGFVVLEMVPGGGCMGNASVTGTILNCVDDSTGDVESTGQCLSVVASRRLHVGTGTISKRSGRS